MQTSCGEKSKFVPYYYIAQPKGVLSFSQLVTAEQQMLVPCSHIARYSKKREFEQLLLRNLTLDTYSFDEAVLVMGQKKDQAVFHAFIPQMPAKVVDQGILFWFTSKEASLWGHLKNMTDDAKVNLFLVPYNKRSFRPGVSFVIMKEHTDLKMIKSQKSFELRLPLDGDGYQNFYEIKILPQLPHYVLETYDMEVKEFAKLWDSTRNSGLRHQDKMVSAMVLFKGPQEQEIVLAASIQDVIYSQDKAELVIKGEFRAAMDLTLGRKRDSGFYNKMTTEWLKGSAHVLVAD